MGKNKDRLNQKSIPWADSILEQVINLPAAGGEDLQSTAEEQVLAVENLLKMVNRKVAENRGEGDYVWKKLTAEGGEFVDFVVSSDTEAFPDGEVHIDGYWYELYEQLPTQAKTVTPKASAQTVIPDIGYLLDSVVVNGDSDLIPSNIRNGVDIFGVIGTLMEGASGIDYGTVTYTTATLTLYQNHKLGVAPRFVLMIPASSDAGSGTYRTNLVLATENSGLMGFTIYKTYANTPVLNYAAPSSAGNFKASNFSVSAASKDYKFLGTYVWVAIA